MRTDVGTDMKIKCQGFQVENPEVVRKKKELDGCYVGVRTWKAFV